MGNYQAFQTDMSESQQQLDLFTAPLSMPMGKLDADQYSAEDRDGVTESLFGSGNLSFLSMQSGQSNDVLALNNYFSSVSNDEVISNVVFSNGSIPTFNSNFSHDNGFGNFTAGQAIESAYVAPAENPANIEIGVNESSLSNTTGGSLGASTGGESTNISFSPSSYISMGGNILGDTYISGIRALLTRGNTVGDTFVENVFQGDITHVANNLTQNITHVGDTVHNVLQDLGVTNIINLGDVVNHVVNNETIGAVTNVVNTVLGDTITNITNNLTDILTGNGHIALNLDASVLDTVGAHVGVLIEDSIAGNVSVNAVTDHLNGVVHDLTGLNIPLVADVGAVIGFDLLNGGAGTDNHAGDTDLVIHGLEGLGLNLPEIALDPVEGLVGDIDITLNLPTELLTPSELVSDLHDTVASIGNLDIATVPEILDIVSPEGLNGALGIELLDHDLTQNLSLTVGDILGEGQALVGGLTENLGVDLQHDLGGVVGDVTAIPNDLLSSSADPSDVVGDVASAVHDTIGAVDATLTDVAHAPEILGSGQDLAADLEQGVGGVIEDVAAVPSHIVEDVVSTTHDTLGSVDSTLTEIANVPAEILGSGQNLGDDLTGNVGSHAEHGLSGLAEAVAAVVPDTVGLVGATLTDVASADAHAPVQSLVSDVVSHIDPVLNDALNLLGGHAGAVADTGLTDSLSHNWTESGVGTGGLFDDIVHGSHMGDMLPDPIGGIAEGLGAIDIPHTATHHVGGALGGLFG